MDKQEGIDRIAGLSDGVIAIAITLLILEVKLPVGEFTTPQELLNGLLSITTQYIGYIMSFMAIGVLWIGHHRRFSHIVKYDRTLVTLNLLFLAAVSFVPFPTRVVVEYGNSTSVAFYSLVMAVAAGLLAVTWVYATAKGYVHTTITHRHKMLELASAMSVACVFLISAALAQYNTSASIATLVLIAPITAILDKLHE